MRIFIIEVRAERMLNLQHGSLRTLRLHWNGKHSITFPTAATTRNADPNTPRRIKGIATKLASDMKWLEWRQGAAKERPLKTSSLKTERKSINCVYTGGHGMSNTTVKEALICKLPISICALWSSEGVR